MMAHPSSIHALHTRVEAALPSLTSCQTRVLSEAVFAMIVTQRQGISSLSTFLAGVRHQPVATVRQRLREWTYARDAKRGLKRRAVDVPATFPALLTWVLDAVPACREHLVLAADATTLSNRMVVLAISVIIDGSAIPVAWHVQRSTDRGAWNTIWQALIARLAPATQALESVLLLTDRGLYSPDLFRAIVAHGWHPLMRINRLGQDETAPGTWTALAAIWPQPGSQWTHHGRCFKRRPLPCTLVGVWDGVAPTPWLLVTDLAPQAVHGRWYRLRMGIEQGFRHLKRGGWNWQLTRMIHPDRIARTWLLLAVATLVVVVLGIQDAPEPCDGEPSMADERRHSVFRKGILHLLAALVEQADAGFAPILAAWLSLPPLKTYP